MNVPHNRVAEAVASGVDGLAAFLEAVQEDAAAAVLRDHRGAVTVAAGVVADAADGRVDPADVAGKVAGAASTILVAQGLPWAAALVSMMAEPVRLAVLRVSVMRLHARGIAGQVSWNK